MTKTVLDNLLAEHTASGNAWLETNAHAIATCNADDIVFAQVSYASQRDAGELEPQFCAQCGRMRMLELAAIKLLNEVLELRRGRSGDAR